MDKRNKIKMENIAERSLGIPFLVATAAVMTALSPVLYGVGFAKAKRKGQPTPETLGDAIATYGNFVKTINSRALENGINLVKEGSDRLAEYDKAQQRIIAQKEMAQRKMAEAKKAEQQRNAEMEESGVAALIDIINNAPYIKLEKKTNTADNYYSFAGIRYYWNLNHVVKESDGTIIIEVPGEFSKDVIQAIIARQDALKEAEIAAQKKAGKDEMAAIRKQLGQRDM